MSKYFFESQDSENCYTIDYFKEQLKDNDLTEMQAYPAKIMIGSGFYYCKELDVSGESNDGECGKWCEHYEPRNSKNGRCVNSSLPYEASEKPITIKI